MQVSPDLHNICFQRVATKLKITFCCHGVTASYLIEKYIIHLTAVPLILSIYEFCFVLKKFRNLIVSLQ
jgi:hypothetical protein